MAVAVEERRDSAVVNVVESVGAEGEVVVSRESLENPASRGMIAMGFLKF